MSDVVAPTKLVSIIAPIYNEADVIKEFYQRLNTTLAEANEQFEIIFINDGSRDRSFSLLQKLQAEDKRISIINFSRNFGKEIALTAGLDHAQGDAVIVIDADLQDPPELIHEMLAAWREGYEMVYAKRLSRKGDRWSKKLTAFAFYRLINRIGDNPIPEDTGDFRLIDRVAVDAINQLRERRRFMKGLFSWVGYKQKAIMYHRDPRYAGSSKWNFLSLWRLATEGITSFSIMPLKLATYTGLVTAAAALLFGLYIIFDALFYGNDVPGYPSLMTVILFLGGIQLIAIGIIGEYIGRMYDEIKQRPLYLVKDYLPAANSARALLKDSNTGDQSSTEV